jgi:hypothetical protein
VRASEVLLDIAEKLRTSQKLTALDAHRLYRVLETITHDLGYADMKDPSLFFDAADILAQNSNEGAL